MNKLIPPNIKLIAPLIFALIGIFVAGLIIYKFGFSQIATQNQRIKDAKEEKNTLSQKETILSGVKENILPAADLSLVTIPSRNSGLAAFSQIKALGAEKGVVISNLILTSGEAGKSLNTVTITFDLDGPAPSIVDFVNAVSFLAPLMQLENLVLSNEPEGGQALVSITAYWASLPTSIPAINDGLSGFSEEEVTALQAFANLKTPLFSTLKPQEEAPRVDPFN